jgi:hypothetical protein
LCYCENDIGETAEWLFYATSHGKDVCVGEAATAKWLATCANLEKTYNLKIMTLFQLHNW